MLETKKWKLAESPYALKYTLFVTIICQEVILRSREVAICTEHALVTSLFVANIQLLYFDESHKRGPFRDALSLCSRFSNFVVENMRLIVFIAP